MELIDVIIAFYANCGVIDAFLGHIDPQRDGAVISKGITKYPVLYILYITP